MTLRTVNRQEAKREGRRVREGSTSAQCNATHEAIGVCLDFSIGFLQKIGSVTNNKNKSPHTRGARGLWTPGVCGFRRAASFSPGGCSSDLWDVSGQPNLSTAGGLELISIGHSTQSV